jgi:hypothetical protein
MKVFVLICAFIHITALIALVSVASRNKRLVRRVLFRFDNSNHGLPLILSMLGVSVVLWLMGYIVDVQLNFLLLLWTPAMLIFINPAYLGEAGLKAGFTFISRERIRSYRVAPGERKNLRLEVDVSGLKKPLILTVYDVRKRDEVTELLDRYLGRRCDSADTLHG